MLRSTIAAAACGLFATGLSAQAQRICEPAAVAFVTDPLNVNPPDSIGVLSTAILRPTPSLGARWGVTILHGAWLPAPVLQSYFIGLSQPLPPPLELPGIGTWLIGGSPIIEFPSSPGAAMELPIPQNLDLCGAILNIQGAAANLTDIRLTTMIRATIGT